MLSTRFQAGAILVGLVLALSGCQSDGGAKAAASGGTAAPEKVSASDLRAYCPTIHLQEGTAYFTTYKRGAEKTPENVVYQASITDVTRACRFNADKSATMTVAIEGKIVPGPAGSTGTVTMPIRVAVLRGEEAIDSKLHKYQVTVDDIAGATQFIYDDRNLLIPAPVDRSLQVLVGYDEGPYGTP